MGSLSGPVVAGEFMVTLTVVFLRDE